MKNNILNSIKIYLPVFLAVVALNFCRAQEEINISTTINVLGQTKPIPVSLEGFTGETNNLNLAKTAALGSEPSPTMGSEQTNGTSSTASCAVAG